MKRFTLLFALLISIGAYSQNVVKETFGSPGISFYTEAKDTLYLQDDHMITPDIISVWETDSTITEKKPIIVTHNNVARLRKNYLAKYEGTKSIR